MDRIIVYPGEIPLDTDILTGSKSAMLALGGLIQAAIGTNTCFYGFAVTQTSPPSMQVVVAPGGVIIQSVVDNTDYGTIPADTVDPLMKMGVNVAATTLGPIVAPAVSGQSQCFLVEAQFVERDIGPAVLPYYNPNNPQQPWSGPSNTGVAQNVLRQQATLLQIKAGSAATTGSQVAPAPDSGWLGVAVITVAFGDTSIVNAHIASYAGALKIGGKVGSLNLGFSNIISLTGSGNWAVPPGVTRIRYRVTGGGGGSGGGDLGGGGGGGAAASGYMVGLTPGALMAYSQGAGGTAGAAGVDGGPGGTTTFGSITAPGGAGGTFGNLSVIGVGGSAGAVATGGTQNWPGGNGSPGNGSGGVGPGGNGGANGFGQAGPVNPLLNPTGGSAGAGLPGVLPGTGASGGGNGQLGAVGAAGGIEIEY